MTLNSLLSEFVMVEIHYHIGLTFMTLAFIYLFYAVTSNKIFKIPKTFLLLYGIGGLFLAIKNINDGHRYIAINEIIGCVISLLLFIRN
jgi:hypothetical protein